MTSSQPASYLIVGAGVFGVSTALHLAAQHPESRITLVDRDGLNPEADARTPRVAASWDWNKVVRADYTDVAYCALALEARDVWRGTNSSLSSSSPPFYDIFPPFYRESGIYWISPSTKGFARAVLENYRRLGREKEIEDGVVRLVPIDEARQLYGGVFAEADYAGVDKVLVNEGSGWADARAALRRGIERARELGVELVTAEVEALQFEDGDLGPEGGGKVCVGVRTKGGSVIRATRTILSTGSYTPKLLDESAERSGIEDLRAGERIVAAGVTTGLTVLNEEDMARFSGMPVGIQENPPERGASNGSLPPDGDKQLKWWGQHIFQNTQTMPSGNALSAPPPKPDYAQWDVSETLKEDISFANTITFGEQGKSWEIEQHRICWEAITPSGDFIISPHPVAAAGSLSVATCGSFHGWKFFPVLGKYVARMLDGSLPDELRKKWAWDRPLPDPLKNNMWPRHELRDLT